MLMSRKCSMVVRRYTGQGGGIQAKVCSGCKRTKYITEFSKRRQEKTGTHTVAGGVALLNGGCTWSKGGHGGLLCVLSVVGGKPGCRWTLIGFAVSTMLFGAGLTNRSQTMARNRSYKFKPDDLRLNSMYSFSIVA